MTCLCSVSADSNAGNLGLCGDPLPLCEGSTKKARTGVIIGAALGSAAIVALVVSGGMMFVMRKVVRKIERKKKKILMKINGPGVSKEPKRSRDGRKLDHPSDSLFIIDY
ncbi:hypothetical protein Hanom_Chr04g00375421 [Helianthus anomalus]